MQSKQRLWLSLCSVKMAPLPLLFNSGVKQRRSVQSSELMYFYSSACEYKQARMAADDGFLWEKREKRNTAGVGCKLQLLCWCYTIDLFTFRKCISNNLLDVFGWSPVMVWFLNIFIQSSVRLNVGNLSKNHWYVYIFTCRTYHFGVSTKRVLIRVSSWYFWQEVYEIFSSILGDKCGYFKPKHDPEKVFFCA